MNATTKIVIVGAGGLGREILAILKAANAVRHHWDVLGFLDADPKLTGSEIGAIPVLGQDDWCEKQNDDSIRYVCAIGSPRGRKRIVEKFLAMNCQFVSVLHPEVQVPETVRIGKGTVIMAGTRFTTDATIGSHVVVYLNCSITHDVSVDDYCLITSGCGLSGAAVLETGVELGHRRHRAPGQAHRRMDDHRCRECGSRRYSQLLACVWSSM